MLLAIGGFAGAANYKVEAVDLSGQQRTCDPIANIPTTSEQTGIYIENSPFICGGQADSSEEIRYCYSFNNAAWQFEVAMIEKRTMVAAMFLCTK